MFSLARLLGTVVQPLFPVTSVFQFSIHPREIQSGARHVIWYIFTEHVLEMAIDYSEVVLQAAII